MLLLAFLLGLDLFLVAASKLNTEEAYVTVARCRINCLKQFLPTGRQNNDNACWNTNNHRTGYSRDCAECWQLCLTFQTSSLFHVACGDNSPACTQPCQAACQFVQNTTAVKPATAEWRFPENASVITDQVEMQITWRPPVMVPAHGQMTPKNQPIVYVLLSRNSNRPSDGWAVLNMIISSSIRIDIDAVPLTPEFLLLAVSEEGLIAQSRFKTQTSPGDIPDPSGAELRKLKDWPEATYYSQTAKNISAQLTFNKTLVRRAAGSHWSQSVEVRFRVPDLLNEHAVHFFKLNWFLVTCREAYNFVPACSLPRDNTAATVYARGKEEVSYVMQDLKFNSIYLLLVQVSEDFRVRVELVFKTEPCLKPDLLQLTRCLDDVKEAELPLVPIVHTLQPVFEPEVLKLSVNVTSMTYQPTSDRVLVKVTWLPLLNRSTESYNVTTFMDGRSLLVSRHVTSHPYISLSLEPHTQYYVKVEAGFRNQPGPDSQPPVFDEILVNTSDVSLAVYQGLEAIRLPSDSLPPDDMDQVDGIIIGVTCFIIVLVLAGLFVVLYKKRKSFKGIIVTKATVAKSNSYKSSVGGKSDYSNQLITFVDEWELDPLKLKFSSLLGQGAFGKVVTGYYDDQKVAIKLVREGAPVSYKEDLVAEITLMKRLGSHPNIVCLIGACTLYEPIALVMEYVPYGNLQNFLKKCRLEGDLRKSSEGLTEITYTVCQESGHMESGVVTPADMLSFARQVSMAMEYLAEKKYVHRDLAARNVLMDHNKVVKVCDFGLSRDIFQDNHYKKLTNGKLPLKWMAIESLRDRIFTTQSDVWSFGILLWEIVTMGASPYPNVALADLYYVLSNGYRMDRPSNCSPELYSIMRSCWEDEPARRPDFTRLRLMLEDLLTEDRDYLVLEDIDVPLSNNSDNSSCPSPPHPVDNQMPSQPDPTGPSGGSSALSTFSSRQHQSPVRLPKKTPARRDNLKISVCIHQKSTDRLIRPSESDSSPSSC